MLTIVCLSHAEDVAIRATRSISNDHNATLEKSEADYSHLAVFFTIVRDLNGEASENYCGIVKVQSTFGEGLLTFSRIVKNFNSQAPSWRLLCLDSADGFAKTVTHWLKWLKN